MKFNLNFQPDFQLCQTFANMYEPLLSKALKTYAYHVCMIQIPIYTKNFINNKTKVRKYFGRITLLSHALYPHLLFIITKCSKNVKNVI